MGQGTETTDYSKSKWAVWIPIIVSVVTLVGGVTAWGVSQYVAQRREAEHAISARRSEDDRLMRDFLVPLQTALQAGEAIHRQLKDRYVRSQKDILEWYVKEAQDAGEDKLNLPHGLISDMVHANAEMTTLVKGYASFVLTTAFKEESTRFLEHARIYETRFNEIPAIIKSGESLPSLKSFPAGFPSALDEEFAARKKHRDRADAKGPKSKFEREFDVAVRTGFVAGAYDCKPEVEKVRADYPNGIFEIKKVSKAARHQSVSADPEYAYLCIIGTKVVDEYSAVMPW